QMVVSSSAAGRCTRCWSFLLFADLSAAGCQTLLPAETMETTGSLAPAGPQNDTDWRHEVEAAGALYRPHPDNGQAAIRYAQALRAIGERTQASAVLEQASIRNANDASVLGAYGRALADAGKHAQALEVLSRAP